MAGRAVVSLYIHLQRDDAGSTPAGRTQRIALSKIDVKSREQKLADTSDAATPTKADGSDSPAKDWSDAHPVNIRLTIPFFSRSFYVAIVAGVERRSRARRAEERRKHPLVTTGNIVVYAILGLCLLGYFHMLWQSLLSVVN